MLCQPGSCGDPGRVVRASRVALFIYAALAGLDIIQEVGVARIRERSKQLTARLLDLVDQQGFSSGASRDPERLAGTVAVSVPDANAKVSGSVARIAKSIEESSRVKASAPGRPKSAITGRYGL